VFPIIEQLPARLTIQDIQGIQERRANRVCYLYVLYALSCSTSSFLKLNWYPYSIQKGSDKAVRLPGMSCMPCMVQNNNLQLSTT